MAHESRINAHISVKTDDVVSFSICLPFVEPISRSASCFSSTHTHTRCPRRCIRQHFASLLKPVFAYISSLLAQRASTKLVLHERRSGSCVFGGLFFSRCNAIFLHSSAAAQCRHNKWMERATSILTWPVVRLDVLVRPKRHYRTWPRCQIMFFFCPADDWTLNWKVDMYIYRCSFYRCNGASKIGLDAGWMANKCQ